MPRSARLQGFALGRANSLVLDRRTDAFTALTNTEPPPAPPVDFAITDPPADP
ncbi:MAG: hypothetical protein JWO19_6110 [Bryobacterales bacterium]|nr:hypothetical protein [Bryobacterales bacterium]